LNTALVGLSSRAGDAPGYIREGLRDLRKLGNVVRNSDLYRAKQPPAGENQDAYYAVAELSTEIQPNDLALALAERSQEFSVLDLCLLAYAGRAAGLVEQAFVLPLADVWADLILRCENRTVGALGRDLPDAVRKSMVRIGGTAELEAVRPLDYDAPNGAGANYDELRPLTTLDRRLLEAVVAAIHLGPNMKVLDVGCGTGRFTELLAQAGASMTGIDRSASMLAAARRKAAASSLAIQYYQGDANRELPPGPYDAVTFFFSIHYIALQREFWLRLRAVLAPEAKIAIVTLPHRHFIETSFAEFFPSIPRVDLARFPSLPALIRSLTEHDFGDIVVREIESKETVAGDLLIERVARKHLSSFHLLKPQEFEAGLSAMRARLAGVQRVERTLRAAVVSGVGHYSEGHPSGVAERIEDGGEQEGSRA